MSSTQSNSETQSHNSSDSSLSRYIPKSAVGKRKRGAMPPSTTNTVSPAASSVTIVGRKDDGARPAKRVRGKRGFLQQVAEMPLEILFEIFSGLEPMDLLNLARTTKALRAILMQQSSRDVWKAALANVPDLPPQPQDLTEPQWVDLLYGKNCHICDRTTPLDAQTYFWEARIRGCFTCVTSSCISWEFLLEKYPSHVRDVTPSFYVESKSRDPLDQGTHYHRSSLQSLAEAYQLLETDEDRTEWISRKLVAKDVLASHAHYCEWWLKSVRSARAEERRDQRVSRKSALCERVRSLGYGATIDEYTFGNPEFWKAACVTSILKKNISDRVWANAKGAFLELIDGYKSKYLAQRRRDNQRKRFTMLVQAHQAYVKSLPISEPVLTAGDLFQRLTVRKIVLAEPLEDEVDPNFLSQVIRKMERYNRAWLEAAKKSLLDMLKPQANLLGLEKNNIEESSLNLAVVLFACRQCKRERLRSRDLFHHSCTRSLKRKELIPSGTLQQVKDFILWTKVTPWNLTSCVAFDSDGAKSAVVLLKKLGLNAATLTVDAVDELDPIFEVTRITVVGGIGRAMYSWRGLLMEKLEKARFCSVLDEKTSASVRELLDEDARRTRAKAGEHWNIQRVGIHCTHCRKYFQDTVKIVKHLTEAHGIQVVSDKDFWSHPDQQLLRTSITYYKHAASTTTLI